MNKYIKSYSAVLILFTAVLVSGCDVFESFQFGLPVRIEIETQGATPIGATSFCFTENETYLEYEDDINSISFVAAYLVTINAPQNLSGDIYLRLYEGTDITGQLLFEHVIMDFTPAEHDSLNPYKIQLTTQQVNDLNASLARKNKCFFGVYQVQNVSGGIGINYIKVKIDALFNVDAKLD